MLRREVPMEAYDAFDLQRMFIGEFSAWLLLEIVLRTVIMYVYALFAVRFVGKRGIGNLSPFEYVLIFALGAAAGDPMLYPEVPLVYGMIVISVIVTMQRALNAATNRSSALEHLFESKPALLVESGRVQNEVLAREGLSTDELMMKLRLAGVANVGRVRYAYLEPSGGLSVFEYEEVRAPGKSTLVG
jgi:uncharacterized membrane protein YcaP (DUF421 family)